MFWRRGRAKEEAVEETDDLVKLQKQFGITPVSDADVQAEFQALLGATGVAGGSSPTEESLLFGTGDDDEDEEAKILRDLQLDGLNLVDVDDEEGDGHQEAKSELRGVLDEVHRTARENHSREAAEMSGEQPMQPPRGNVVELPPERAAEVHALKMEALALKREGKIQEALVKFREAKQLQEHYSTQGSVVNAHSSSRTVVSMRSEMKVEQSARQPVETLLDDGDHDVEVTDEDMQDPEFLAQLAKMGLTEDDAQGSNDTEAARYHDVMQQLTVVERQIHECAVVLDEENPDSENDSMSDVEVTAEDMNDPAFAVELQKLGVEGASSNESAQAYAHTLPDIVPAPIAAPPKPTLSSSRSLKNTPSIDEDYLIDAFDESDSEGETNHLTTVMSSGSLYSISSTTETEKSESQVREASAKGEVDNCHVADLNSQLQKARQTALTLKRKGDIQGALESMRRAKQIQTLIDRKQQAAGIPPTPLAPAQDSINAANFQKVEQLLVEFGNRAATLAKDNLSVNREKASEWLGKRKRYGAELEKLRQMRQNPLQLAPRYGIIKSSHQVEFELPFVPDDQIKVSVKSVNELSRVAGKSVFVKFCLNFPSAIPHEGQTEEFEISRKSPYSTEIPSTQSFSFRLARSRGTMRLFEIKKAVFEVWKPGTLFRNPELVARAYQELTPLLTSCEINTHIPFLGSNRKPCGGDIEIALQMRRPLKEKETRLETVEDLVIGDYLEPMPSLPTHAPMPSVALEETHININAERIAPTPAPTNQAKEDQGSFLTASLDDPHHVDLIVSYDVINEELEKLGAKLPSLTGPAAIELSDRYDSLALKKQLLEIEMQTGKLTLDMYVKRLHTRISADRVLISQLLASNRRLDAARVLHRVKLMEKELEGTEGGSEHE
ncbi:Coiled-coil and C2 domain-containing protein 1B [Phytophthora cinnamomi]|uniref:Coiled-coil and C2 domain-containing protein 1B n=1 Tax=Phytophthora cinnamomi TaxID=4785 RepID=UPI00355AC805|nr:Coiled-coil and C2 domain-containing protein 1B [Phytophthora cinnamomi]